MNNYKTLPLSTWYGKFSWHDADSMAKIRVYTTTLASELGSQV